MTSLPKRRPSAHTDKRLSIVSEGLARGPNAVTALDEAREGRGRNEMGGERITLSSFQKMTLKSHTSHSPLYSLRKGKPACYESGKDVATIQSKPRSRVDSDYLSHEVSFALAFHFK